MGDPSDPFFNQSSLVNDANSKIACAAVALKDLTAFQRAFIIISR